MFVDLSSLCSCPGIYEINLKNEKLKELNITPLYFCASFHELIIPNKVTLTSDPVASLTFGNREFIKAKRKIRFNRQYDTLVEKEGWRSVLNSTKHLLRHISPRYHFIAQRGLLMGLRMEEISGYDGDPLDIIRSIPEDLDYEKSRDRIYTKMIELIEDQIEKGGSTHFLDVDKLVVSRGHILVQSIIEARKEEIESLEIPIVDGKTDGRRIWATSYGFKIMREFGFNPFNGPSQHVDRIKLRDIERALKGAGMKVVKYDCKREKKPIYKSHISKGLIYYLENIGKSAFTVEEYAKEHKKIHDTGTYTPPKVKVEST